MNLVYIFRFFNIRPLSISGSLPGPIVKSFGPVIGVPLKLLMNTSQLGVLSKCE
tara:strand:+ start:381 stop:542 length:162 start_codon:yes stop_codon:yes gene_type:complete